MSTVVPDTITMNVVIPFVCAKWLIVSFSVTTSLILNFDLGFLTETGVLICNVVGSAYRFV